MRKLSQVHADLTERLILEAAIQMLESASLRELTVRAVAKEAGISERTIFRYFPSRDRFLDAISEELSRKLDLPPHPASIDELFAYPSRLFKAFEANQVLTRASLHSDLRERRIATTAKARWAAVQALIDAHAPAAPERQRRIAAANIRFFLSATTWQYYRFMLHLGLEETIECAETAIGQALAALGAIQAPAVRAPARQ